MTEVIIKDVPIKFPFKPYKVQEDYMSKVLECLQKGVNGVLESPTGTGKTLSLLCASLAWLQIKKAQQQANSYGLMLNAEPGKESFSKNLQMELQKSAGAAVESQDGAWSKMLSRPYIVYASRTHSQLTQVMKELKRTSYSHVKATVLGSRDQLCLHPELAEEQGFMKVTLCRAKMKAKTCHYFNNLEMKRNSAEKLTSLPEVTDIEDLVKLGQRTQCCAYYLARESMTDADIVFMPYNYLLDPHTRRAQKIVLNNAVVILDEAHNVESTCEEAASVSINSTDIALCIGDVTQAMKKYVEIEKINEAGGTGEDLNQDFSMEELCVLKSMFLALEAAVDEIQLPASNNGVKSGKTFPGTYIFELLAKAEIVMNKLVLLDECLTKLAQFISTTSDSISRKGSSLTKFNEFLKVVYESCASGDRSDTDLYYKVHVEQELPKKSKPDSWSSTKTTLNNKAKVINFWCFSSGFAMRSMLRQGVHCVILTSGTLSPLQATISELGIPVPVTLENPHIIQPSQVSVVVMNKGPTGEKLISNYTNRENPKYLSDLGGILKNLSRVIPDGVLMFFTSYPVMQKVIDYWQQEGLWSQICAVKPVFVEPQRRDSLTEVLRDYQQALEVEGSRGAVLLAVLRGKVSEGMDFADTRARAVLVTGLPYSPFKDPRVILKQEYLDNARKNNVQGLTGRQWYEQDAVRAVNQAVGRVIRHASDFGSILLCDCRFKQPAVSNTLSAWLRSQLVSCEEFGQAYGRISRFFRDLGLNPPTRPGHVGASFDYVEGKVRTKEESKEEAAAKNKSQAILSQMRFFEKFRNNEPKAVAQPSPRGLLDALSSSTTQTPVVDILKSVYENPETEVKESYVQPAPKKRKLRIVPLNFDMDSDNCSSMSGTTADLSSEQANYTAGQNENINKVSGKFLDAASKQAERKKTHQEYINEVRKKLSEENFARFKEIVKSYAKAEEANYDKTILFLRKVFPDSSSKDLFLRFQRFIRPEHMAQFQDLCFRLFGSKS